MRFEDNKILIHFDDLIQMTGLSRNQILREIESGQSNFTVSKVDPNLFELCLVESDLLMTSREVCETLGIGSDELELLLFKFKIQKYFQKSGDFLINFTDLYTRIM